MRGFFLLIDKPAGITSHDVIDRLRVITGERTIGHAGTLDPFATGLLIVAVGREATKHLDRFVGLDKTYEADICLGRSSTTLDPEGVLTDGPIVSIAPETLTKVMQQLTGPLMQIPPMHAAIKIGGKKLYELARQGKDIDRPPRPITVSEFILLEPCGHGAAVPTPLTIRCRIRCSSGTYVRALARDLGALLGTSAYLTALRRTAIGLFDVCQATKLDTLTASNWIDAQQEDMIPSQRNS